MMNGLKYYEPYWTEKMVEAYLQDAADVMKTLPPVKVQGYFTTWPEPIRDYWDLYGCADPKPKMMRPLPRQIDQMEYVCEWLRWTTILESKIIWDRATGLPWKVIEHRRQSSRSTLWRHYSCGISKIVARLNARDPDGEKIAYFGV